tara:strand:+ start:1091 stop:1249 length:159 start_codon:yes stop_codon:yes gene_type:complete
MLQLSGRESRLELEQEMTALVEEALAEAEVEIRIVTSSSEVQRIVRPFALAF